MRFFRGGYVRAFGRYVFEANPENEEVAGCEYDMAPGQKLCVV